MEIVFGIFLVAGMCVCAFILGGLFARRLMCDALEEARRQRVTEEYYRLAGAHRQSDPKPYVPPAIRPKTPRSRYLPHMNTLDRLLHEGKRGTIMVRAGDYYRK